MKLPYFFLTFILFLSFTTQGLFSQPLLQNAYHRSKTSLDGLWQVIIDPMENGYLRGNLKPRDKTYFSNQKMEAPTDLIEYDFDGAQQLKVPGDWNTQMEQLYYYEGTVWYKRSFNYSKKDAGKVFLRFGAVNYHCMVYLNGKHLGEHTGGFTPFEFEVTDLLEEENFLILKVNNTRVREGVPTINFDWWNYGGITRSVELIELPHTYIANYSVQLGKSGKSVEAWVRLGGDEPSFRTVTIEVEELGINTKVQTNDQGLAQFTIDKKPALWSPDDPKLYTVRLSTDQDNIQDLIGFRTISNNSRQILLNGEPIFLKGISIHEQAPYGNGRVTSIEQCRLLLNWAKELGCNFVRLAHYPHNEMMVREAEKMGFLIWSEIPVYWAIDYSNPETYQNAERQLLDMIDRDKNRAGIVLWSVANETPISEERMAFLRSLIQKIRDTDSTRLITAALNSHREGKEGEIMIDDPLGEYIDVIGINNYCGWYNNRDGESCREVVWKSAYAKPMIMSEMGAGALYGYHGNPNEIWTEEFQANVYDCNMDMIKNIDFLAGMSPWILMDFRSPRRNLFRIQQNYNRKGLLSEEGQKKKAFFVLQNFYNSWDGFWRK